MTQRLQQILADCASKWRTRRVAQDPECVAFLEDLYPGVPLALQIHSWLTKTSPYCEVCGTPVKTQGKRTCSVPCRDHVAKSNTSARVARQQQTLMEKYGVDQVAKIPGVKQRRLATMQQKYGALVSPRTRQAAQQRSEQLQVLGRATLMARHGVSNPGQLPDHAAKCQRTSLENHGAPHYRQSQQFRDQQARDRQQRWCQFAPPTITVLDVQDAEPEKTQKYPHANALIRFRCDQCGGSQSLASETFRWRVQNTGTSCVKCANIQQGSAAENHIRQYIHSLGFETQDHVRSLDGREIDIFIPVAGLGIEYHGLFWHNDLRQDPRYHVSKLESALRNNIRLIQIFEDEWVHHADIVRGRLAHMLGRGGQRLQARHCVVREITADQAREFLQLNHIQGPARSTVKLGLFHQDRLVSVMTFAMLSRAKGHVSRPGHWELSRFCHDLSLSVVGGASKLFTHFVRTHAPEQVLSFADRRWSQGDLYGQLGFEHTGDTDINYWYIDLAKTRRIHRYQLRKCSDDDPGLTEYENRLRQGYLRIHDCGSSRWIWKPPATA